MTVNNLVSIIITALEARHVSPQIITVLISMIPLLELRGSIIVAGSILKLPLVQTYIAAVLGNMLPIPFILLFIRKIFEWMKKISFLKKIPEWIENRTMKRSGQIEKYGYFGLFLFVAIPLPGTGAWTGSLLAVLFGMDFKKSLLFIFLGVLTAGFVMSLVSFGAINGILGLL